MATTSEAFFCHKCRAKAEGLAALTQKVQSVEKDLASAIREEVAVPDDTQEKVDCHAVSVS